MCILIVMCNFIVTCIFICICVCVCEYVYVYVYEICI